MRLLLLSGSTRSGSTNNAALAAVAAAAPPHWVTDLYSGLADLPAFNPDNDVPERLPKPVVNLRKRIGSADVVLICTPEYAGTLPGAFKNLLDWTVGGVEMSERRVAWMNVAAPSRGHGAIQTLELVLRYVGATLLENACCDIPVPSASIGTDGTVNDSRLAARLGIIWQWFVEH